MGKIYYHRQSFNGISKSVRGAKEVFWMSDKRKDRIGSSITNDTKLHRVDGPALIKWDGSEEWYFEGKLHRIGGPAVIQKQYVRNSYTNFDELDYEPLPQLHYAYYEDGKRHRLNGPQSYTFNTNNNKLIQEGAWFIKDKRYSVQDMMDFSRKYLDGKHYKDWDEADLMVLVLCFT